MRAHLTGLCPRSVVYIFSLGNIFNVYARLNHSYHFGRGFYQTSVLRQHFAAH